LYNPYLRFPKFGEEEQRSEFHITDLISEENFCSTCGKYMFEPFIIINEELFCSKECSEYETLE